MSAIQRRITNNYGPRRNMNGAGAGGRLVAKRQKDANGRVVRVIAGQSQTGSRNQKYRDLRVAMGLSAG